MSPSGGQPAPADASPSPRGWWARLEPATGAAFVVLVFGSVFLAPPPPGTQESIETIQSFFQDHRTGLLAQQYLSGISAILLLWFLGCLRSTLRQIDYETERWSAVAFGSGVVLAVFMLLGSWIFATLTLEVGRAGEPGARPLLELGRTISHFTPFPTILLLVAAALAMLRTSPVFRRLGWLALLTAGLLLAASVELVLEDQELPGGWLSSAVRGFSFLFLFLWLLITSLIMALQA